MSKYILCLDQGTTGSTACILNKRGEIVAQADEDFRQIYPQAGWVEHDPKDIWKSVTNTVQKAMQKASIQSQDLAAIGITNQRETVIVWDRKTGEPIYNAIVWQCRRTADFCDKIKKDKKNVQLIRRKTGLVIDPYFSASKIRWILNHVPGALKRAHAGELAVGTIDTYLCWKLTNGEVHATDVSNASRTQLMNIHTGNWDADLLKIFGIPEQVLPGIFPSSGLFGVTRNNAAIGGGIPISGIAGDQQAALFGQACFDVGTAKCTYGTGSFILMNTGNKAVPSKSGLLTTVAWQLSGEKKLTYALEGSVFVCGAAVQWLRDGLGFIKSSEEIELMARGVSSTDGVEFVPALTGLGAPHWDPHARGTIVGLTRGTTRAHIARATLEAMALQNCDLLSAMTKDSEKKLKILKVDGGASANNMLMQLQSDYLNTLIERPKRIETTSMGAGFLAGLGVGFWKSLDEIRDIWALDHSFVPTLKSKDRQQRFDRWARAIKACRKFAEL